MMNQMDDTPPVVAAYTQQPPVPSAAVAASGGVVPQSLAGNEQLQNRTAVDAVLRQIASEASEEIPDFVGEGFVERTEAMSYNRRPRILLGVSGSVATVKLSVVVKRLLEWADVHIVSSNSARHFFKDADLPPSCLPVLTDEDEWRNWSRVGDPVVHIELRRWADAFIIAPLSANTLAKLANGMCDNLLTCVVRAWNFSKPLIVAPAMNSHMWRNPFTEKHLAACQDLGIVVVPPVSKKLACGDVGIGGMASPESIVETARQSLSDNGFRFHEDTMKGNVDVDAL
jgi:phosphopantothenoylcysteine decarboxylase